MNDSSAVPLTHERIEFATEGGVLRLEIAIPTSWVGGNVSEGGVGFKLNAAPTAYAPNVVILVDSFSGSPRDFASKVSADLKGLAGFAALDETEFSIGDQIWSVWEYAFTDSAAGTVVQSTAARVDEAVSLAVMIIGSVDAESAADWVPVIRRILRSAELDIGKLVN